MTVDAILTLPDAPVKFKVLCAWPRPLSFRSLLFEVVRQSFKERSIVSIFIIISLLKYLLTRGACSPALLAVEASLVFLRFSRSSYNAS
jgi:hypothetical protein